MKVVIIEDEPLMSDALKEELLQSGEAVEVVAQIGSIQQGIAYLESNGFPDLFFSDIELSDGLSFEIFQKTQSTTPVVFCTAYNHYALEAFRVFGIDYILKPFEGADIKAALQKYQTLVAKDASRELDYSALLKMLVPTNEVRQTSILIHRKDKIIPLPIEEVALASLQRGVVHLHTFNKQRFLVNYSMERLLQILGSSFYRLNRQHLICRKAVVQASQYFGRKLLVHPVIEYPEPLIVSKSNTGDFLRWLEAS
ncbi:MAG: LytTR family DNA-binding domain-containing protein [Bacteroidota bacterium]